MRTERAQLMYIINSLPFSLQKKFMVIIMDKYSTIDLFKVKAEVLSNELETLLKSESNKMSPYITEISKMSNIILN